MPSIRERFTAAMRAFREPALVADPIDPDPLGGFGAHANRLIRYYLHWALYEQEAFRDTDKWPDSFRANRDLRRGMSRYTRDLLGVAYGLGEFWVTHLQGGLLDPAAGAGKVVPSALPITMRVERPEIRVALAELWKRSNWQIAKSIMTRWGAVLGDVFIEVRDDPADKRVRLNVLHPGHVKSVELDREGNVQGYEIESRQADPRPGNGNSRSRVRYGERVDRDRKRGLIVYRTFLDDRPYQWPGDPGTTWEKRLPFVPLVKIQHKNIGVGWGQAEIAPALAGSREVAELGSVMTDSARKAFHSPHLLAGVKKPETTPNTSVQPDVLPLLYAENVQASAHSLMQPYDFAGVGQHLDRLRAKLLTDYPELSFERIRVQGDASAIAIREARKPAESKVRERRVEYDDGFVRACKMALTMGGMAGYEPYGAFNEGSYGNGEMDFGVGDRSVFESSPGERIEENMAQAGHLELLVKAGTPLEIAYEIAGYPKEIVNKLREGMAARASQVAGFQAQGDQPAVGTEDIDQ